MLRKILLYGMIAGLIVGVPMVATWTLLNGHQPLKHSMFIGYATMLVALSTIFIAIKRHRDVDGGGVIKFWPALGLGLGISVVAGLLYVVAWELTQAISHMDFAGDYTASMIAHQKAKGMSGEALAKFTAEMEAFKTQYANPLYRWPMTFIEIFPVGVLVSIVSAALLCNSRFLPAKR